MSDDARNDIRDALALERTRLANERTLLAYVRTALALFAVAAALFHFLASHPLVTLLGWLLLALGAVILLAGMARFARVRARLRGPGGGS